MNKFSYKDLLIWSKSVDLGLILYPLVNQFPKYEQYALSDQMRRCIVSIASNIAEGHARNSKKENIHFLSISRGSIAELQTQIHFAIELGYINKEVGENIIFQYSGVDIMITKYMESFNRKSNSLKSLLTSFLSLLP